MREIVRAIRREVGPDFHQMKISAVDYNNAIFFWEEEGNTLQESIQVCNWLVQDGVDAIHVSAGNMFPTPATPWEASPSTTPCAGTTGCSPAGSTPGATTA